VSVTFGDLNHSVISPFAEQLLKLGIALCGNREAQFVADAIHPHVVFNEGRRWPLVSTMDAISSFSTSSAPFNV
jgi:hypothetical protein